MKRHCPSYPQRTRTEINTPGKLIDIVHGFTRALRVYLVPLSPVRCFCPRPAGSLLLEDERSSSSTGLFAAVYLHPFRSRSGSHRLSPLCGPWPLPFQEELGITDLLTFVQHLADSFLTLEQMSGTASLQRHPLAERAAVGIPGHRRRRPGIPTDPRMPQGQALRPLLRPPAEGTELAPRYGLNIFGRHVPSSPCSSATPRFLCSVSVTTRASCAAWADTATTFRSPGRGIPKPRPMAPAQWTRRTPGLARLRLMPRSTCRVPGNVPSGSQRPVEAPVSGHLCQQAGTLPRPMLTIC